MTPNLTKLAESLEWKSIKTAPKDGTPVLVAVGGEEYFARSAWYDDEKGIWLINERPCVYLSVSPTHWMHLPTPPESEAA